MIGWAGLRHRASPDRSIRRALRALPATPVAQLAPGLAKVVGQIRGQGPLLKAPATGRPCVGFRLWVEDAARGHWFQLERLAEFVPFAVDDGTGQVEVD